MTQAALIALSLAAVVSLGRLFSHMTPFVARVGVAVIAIHGVCWLCRRTGLGLAVAALASAVVLFLLTGWTTMPHSTFYGLAGRGTIAEVARGLSAAMNGVRTTAAPTKVTPGFVVAGALGCSCAAFLADWAAFRMRATVEACLPSFSLFVFSASLARGHGTSLAVGVWIAALLCFLLVSEAGMDSAPAAWFASRSARGPAAVFKLGTMLIAATVAVAVLLAPSLPGASTHGVVDFRHSSGGGAGGGGQTVNSPLVDARSRITEQSDVEVFTVQSAQPYYWRLAALNRFDGNGWTLADSYSSVSGRLPLPPQVAPGLPRISAHFSISNLGSAWLPAPYPPSAITIKVGYNAEASTLYNNKPQSANGLQYDVQAIDTAPQVSALRDSPPVTDPALAPYLDLPADVATDLLQYEKEATVGAITPYEMARALQDWFISHFTYSLNAPPDDSARAIRNFLDPNNRKGFCQQFASAYAAMARGLGLPARVAVGFTPGILGSDHLYHVSNLQYHAWPEVYFDKFGWLAFEPTPGRGSLQTLPYTGRPPDQAVPTDPNVATTTPELPTLARPVVPSPSPKPRQSANDRQGGSSAQSGGLRGPWSATVQTTATVVLLALLSLLATTPAVTVWRRIRRRKAAVTAGAKVLLAWDDVHRRLAVLGAPLRSFDTPSEYVHRASRAAGLSAPESQCLTRLANAVERACYSGADIGPEEATAAAADLNLITSAVAARQSRSQRIGGMFDPRRLRQ